MAASAYAQAPKYRPPPPPTKGTAIEIRARYLIAPDINFTGLGSVPFRTVYESTNNLIIGSERAIRYDDGILAQDFVTATLIAGGMENGELTLPRTNADATSNFTYVNEEQVDGDALIFHRYAASAPTDVELEGSGSGSLGWELNYTKYINRKRNLGVQVGFSFNGFDSRFNDEIQADLIVQEFRHEMVEGQTVPELKEVQDSEGNVTTEPYKGPRVREEDSPLLLWLAADEETREEMGAATVESQADFRSSIYNFRAGPTYNLTMTERIGFQMGAGVSAIYYSGRFSAFEMLQIENIGNDPVRGLTTTQDAEWQVGGYLDANAYFQWTDRVSLFSGFQVQSGSAYNQMNEEREVNVDFSTQMYIHAGVGIRF